MKKRIESFLYTGTSEWYLRIPLSQPKGLPRCIYFPQFFHTEYLCKDRYTIRQALERRLKLVIQFENEGRRKKWNGKNRWCSSEKFIQDEKDGLYDKYDNW